MGKVFLIERHQFRVAGSCAKVARALGGADVILIARDQKPRLEKAA